jgi:hypothetical protein
MNKKNKIFKKWERKNKRSRVKKWLKKCKRKSLKIKLLVLKIKINQLKFNSKYYLELNELFRYVKQVEN